MNLNNFDKIYVLVSGGIDSTYLYEKLKRFYKEKVFPVNCFNPFEQSETLDQISKDPNFIQIFPTKNHRNYGEVLKNAFFKLPHAKQLKEQGKYHKKIFDCCRIIKHDAFKKDPLFQKEECIVISGIKHGDGSQRAAFLSQLRKGKKYIGTSKIPNNFCYLNEGKEQSTFFHKHKEGQIYGYPFRDYYKKELPEICIKRLRKKYPTITHSGCSICPVLVLFNIVSEGERYEKSIEYMKKLGISIN